MKIENHKDGHPETSNMGKKRQQIEQPQDEGDVSKRNKVQVPFLDDLPEVLTFIPSEQREGMSFIKGSNKKDYTRQFALKSNPVDLREVREPMKGSSKYSLLFDIPVDGDFHRAIGAITEKCEHDFFSKDLTYDEFLTPLKITDGSVQVSMKCDPKMLELKEIKHTADGKMAEVNCSLQTLGKFQWKAVGLCAPDLTWRMTMEDGLVKAGWTMKARRLWVTKQLDDDGQPIKAVSKKGSYGSLV